MLNIQTSAEEKRFIKSGSSYIVDNVNEHVISWGDKRRNEIEELKRLEVYRREFIGNVSHELKTPIFNIQGYVLTLLDGGLEDAAINRNYLLKTEKNIDRMITIINDLEMISRLEASQLRLNEVKFDLIGLVKETMEILEPKAQKKKIDISLDKRYEQARSKEKPGSGLGLAIVKHIIEAHNQTIKVRSKLGEGTTFAFTLRKA